jgi:hypothetical protein
MSDTLDPKSATRRGALGLGAASLALAAAAGSATTASAKSEKKIPIQLDDPVWNRETAARIQADTTGKQVYGHCHGTVCGVRPGEAIRDLFNFEVFSTIRVLRQSDGSYQRMTKECILYTDVKTGEVLNEFLNPYTGETVKVVHVYNDPYNWMIASTIQPPALPGKPSTGQAVVGSKPYLLKWLDYGPDTLVMEDGGHGYYKNLLDPQHWPRESSGEYIQATELFRYFINKSDLENPEMTFIPANGSWVRVQPWLPWMLMGQAPGHIMYDGMFRAERTYDYVPKPVLAYMREHHPESFEAPTHWYGPNYSSLEHYAREQKPAPVK